MVCTNNYIYKNDAKNTSAMAQPLYQQVAEKLKLQLTSSNVHENSSIPSERDLAIEYAVSRETIRKAIHILETQGILYSDQGRGTFVAPQSVHEMSRSLGSFTEDTIKRGGAPNQKILCIDNIIANMALASLLHVKQDTPLIRIKRLRYLNEQLVGLQDSYLYLAAGTRIDHNELIRIGSLYRYLVEILGIVPAESLESIGAIGASAEDAQLLGVPVASPLLICERVMLSERREPVEYCEMKYLPSYRYKTRIAK